METEYQGIAAKTNESFRFFQNAKDNNRNKGICCTISDCTLPPKTGCGFKPVDQMDECFKELRIQTEREHLAGNISSIIETLNVVLVKPFSSDILLYFGTPLFLNCTNDRSSVAKYTLLGYIDDIFGSIGEPMYSITIKCNPKEVLNLNAQVYYFPNDPDTLHMYVEHTVDNTFNNRKYSVITKNL